MRYEKDLSKRRIDLFFDTIPSSETRSFLKAEGWRWHKMRGCWFTFLSDHNENIAKSLVALGPNAGAANKVSNVNITKWASRPVEAKKADDHTDAHTDFLNKPPFSGKSKAEIAEMLFSIVTAVPMKINLPDIQPYELTRAVLCRPDGKMVAISIVDSELSQNSAQNFYWEGRSIGKAILRGILNQRAWVLYHDMPCLILSYAETPRLLKKLELMNAFSNQTDLVTVWIYKGKMPCPQHPEEVESVTAYVPSVREYKSCPLNVCFCKHCNKYYINETQYNEYAEKYGLPFIRLRSQEIHFDSADYTTWREESTLHFLGYNVGVADNLSDEERRRILTCAMETNTLSKPQIIGFLESLIRRNTGRLRMENACSKWNEDLHFVYEYKIRDQREIFAEFQKRQ